MQRLFGFRTLDPDPDRAQALVEAVGFLRTTVGGAGHPHYLPGGDEWTGDQPRGLDYWVRLHDIYQGEIVDERDRFYLAMLKQLGIERASPSPPTTGSRRSSTRTRRRR